MSGQWTSTNPGCGAPPEIRAEAGRRRSHAEDLRQGSGHVGTASSEVSTGWQSQAGTALSSVTATVLSELSSLSGQVSAVADALSRYANDVDTIQQQQRAIEARQDDMTTALTRARRTLDGLRSDRDADASDVYYAQGQVEALNWQLRGFSGQLAALASEGSTADSAAVATLTGADTRGSLAGLITELPSGASLAKGATLTLEELATLSVTELAALFALYPDLAQQMPESDPGTVAEWWASLPTETQTALVLGAPGLIGSLGGVSPVARAAANRLNAATRLAEIDARLAELRSVPTSGGFSTPAYGYEAGTFDAEIAKLQAERGYLTKAVDGKVQLYLYEPSTQSIIEMIGTPGPDTTAINTYVPGTFTSVFSFYNGGVQQVANWLQERDPGQVTFVWKGGTFPGENPATGEAQIVPRILEANFQPFATVKGLQVAEFESEMRAATTSAAGADHNGMGHSWGLPVITSAEVAGVHYDHVVSLSGAGMPASWEAQDGTAYSHYAYRDALTMAQQTGQVWDGRNPGTSSDFEQHQYSTPKDVTIVTPPVMNPLSGGRPDVLIPGVVIPATTDPIGNHDLVASSKEENIRVLRDVLNELQR